MDGRKLEMAGALVNRVPAHGPKNTKKKPGSRSKASVKLAVSRQKAGVGRSGAAKYADTDDFMA
jgi:hypothetical protein